MRFSVDHDWKIFDVDADELHFGRLLNERKDIEAVDLSNNNVLVMVGDADRPSRTFPEIARAGSAASTVIDGVYFKNLPQRSMRPLSSKATFLPKAVRY